MRLCFELRGCALYAIDWEFLFAKCRPPIGIIVSGFRAFSVTQHEQFMSVISVFDASKSLDRFLALTSARLYADDGIECEMQTGREGLRRREDAKLIMSRNVWLLDAIR
jgi:hypothetical protein